jgi:predicted alpha/beta-fold hydrolase
VCSSDLATPLAVLTARDDSVCPPQDFEGLNARGGVVSYQTTSRGGHCGFIRNWGLDCWLDPQVLMLLQRHA